MISIHSSQENNFVYNLVKNDSWIHVWIGGKRNNNRFEWINGKAFNYTNWVSGEPNGGDYVGMSRRYGDYGMWFDDEDYNNTFLCEYIRFH